MNNNEENINTLKKELLEKTNSILKYHQINNSANTKLNENMIKQAIIEKCDIIYIDYSENNDMSEYTYGIYNPRINSYVRDSLFLKELIEYIIDKQDKLPNMSIKTVASNIDDSIMVSRDKINKANLPPKYLTKMNNCIINLKTKDIYDLDDECINQYDFIDGINYNLYDLQNVNQDMLEIIKRIFNNWSANDNDIERVIREMFFAYIEGNGKNVQIILKSDGGDGKSTAMRMIKKMGSPDLTKSINLNEYDDDNTLNQIQPSTRFILGDDLSGNFKMNSKITSRFKTLVDGGYINVNEKYMPNRVINCQGLKIQATNTDLKVFENNPAIQDRIVLINWNHCNFRRNPVTDFNLDELSGKYGLPNTEFMEALISYIVFNTDYFTKFSVTDQMRNDVSQMLDANDIVIQHLNEIKDMNCLYLSHLPLKVLYEHFKQWLKDINPSSKPLKFIDYSKRIKSLLEKEGYTNNKRKRIRSLSHSQFNRSLFDNINIDESSLSTVMIKDDDEYNYSVEELESLIINHIASHSQLIDYINIKKECDERFIMRIATNLNIPINDIFKVSTNELMNAINEEINY